MRNWRRVLWILAIVPLETVPARFVMSTLYEESFVIVTRAGHGYSRDPSLDQYCDMQHILVSLTGDSHGMFDDYLAALGRSRRVALTVPNFMQAMLMLSGTDFVTAVPRRLADAYAGRLDLEIAEVPLERPA